MIGLHGAVSAADAASRAQKCSRFHPLSAYTGEMRTCAVKLQLQWDRRRARLIASGGVPRGRGVALAVASAAAKSAEAESAGNGVEETAATTMTAQGKASSAPPARAGGQHIGSEQSAGAGAVPESAPEPQTAAAARAAASALAILATQAYRAPEPAVAALKGDAG
jgi:hypothetical protein